MKTLHDFFSSNLVKLDLDLDPDPDSDPHSEKLQDPDLDQHIINADPQPCYTECILYSGCIIFFLFFYVPTY